MIEETLKIKKLWTIRKYADDQAYQADQPYEVSEFEGNMLLNEGIAELLDLLCGLGTPTAFSNANARLGVGDSSAAEAATQTALQAATNKLWKAMEATYPSRASQTVTFRSVFGSTDANYAWNEFTVVNAADDTGDNLNRKVSAQGTKAAGQTWTLDLSLTLS